MKVTQAFSAAIIALVCYVGPTNGESSPYDRQQVGDSAFNRPQERRLVVGGAVSQTGARTYTTGLRFTKDGESFCGGSFITPSHILTASHCVEGDIRWASIGSHYINGTQDGEQIRVLSLMNHLNFSSKGEEVLQDFAILEPERPSTFKPVKLAATDGSHTKTGDWGRSSAGAEQPRTERCRTNSKK